MCRDELAAWQIEVQAQGWESRAVHVAAPPLPKGSARLTNMACQYSASGNLIIAGMLMPALTIYMYSNSRDIAKLIL